MIFTSFLLNCIKGGDGSYEGWASSLGNGWISIENHTTGPVGNSTQYSYFVHRNRESNDEGPRQNIDPFCLVVGSQYQITFVVKLTYSNGTEYFCTKGAFAIKLSEWS